MPSYSGVWNLVAQFQAKANLQWPQGPGAPTSVTATAGDTQADVSFVAPTFTGVPPGITGYLATSSPGGLTATGASSPLTVTGLTNGTAYTFNVQATNGVQYGPAGTSGSVTPASVRAVFAGGTTATDVMGYINVGSTGNATYFGALSSAATGCMGLASSTRGVFARMQNNSLPSNSLEYITIATTGNTTTFGQLLTVYNDGQGSCNSATRGIFSPQADIVEYITIASTGNATSFGSKSNLSLTASCSSSTRGLFGGGGAPSNAIDYITIATTGNSSSFGQLTVARYNLAACSNSTRGLFAGGSPASGPTYNTIDYVTIASTGNATDFGDLASLTWGLAGASSSSRAVFGGGYVAALSASINVLQYVTIATTSNTTNFGELTVAVRRVGACSSGNGGVQ